MRRLVGGVAIGALLLAGLMVGPATAQQGCVDLNSADLEELQLLTGVGPERASQIIDLRPFDSVDDLVAVEGFNGTDANLDELKDATGEGSLPPCPIGQPAPTSAATAPDTDDGSQPPGGVPEPSGTVDAGSGGLIATDVPAFVYAVMIAGLLMATCGAVVWSKDW